MKFVRGTSAAVAALLLAAGFAGSASARGVVVEDWLGASGSTYFQGISVALDQLNLDLVVDR